jgi:hypothetical protein
MSDLPRGRAWTVVEQHVNNAIRSYQDGDSTDDAFVVLDVARAEHLHVERMATVVEAMADLERRGHALREALEEIANTYGLNLPPTVEGKRLREIARAALKAEADAKG